MKHMMLLGTVVVLLALMPTASSAPPTYVAFGPASFVRTTGEPVVETVTFSMPVGGSVDLVIQNGMKDDATLGERVSSSAIMLNGVEVVGPNQFS